MFFIRLVFAGGGFEIAVLLLEIDEACFKRLSQRLSYLENKKRVVTLICYNPLVCWLLRQDSNLRPID